MKSNKKRILLVLAILTMAIVLSFVFVACGTDADKQGRQFTITFDTQGGSKIEPIKIKAGATITLPNNPTKEGYIFDGWYLSDALVEEFNITKTITGDITLYAKWIEDNGQEEPPVAKTYSITFMVDGVTYKTVNISEGSVITLPENPEKKCCIFEGWYIGEDLLEKFNATQDISQDIVVYAKWSDNHTVVEDPEVPATCTTAGLTAGKHCSVCNEILKAQTEIPALGHDLETHTGKPATCTEKGWEAYDTCKRDGCTYTTYQEINALGHTGGTATCTEQAVCERCNEKYGNALGHKYGTLIPQTNATCSATGIRSHYKCSSCNKLFADDEHKTEITEMDLIIPVDENAHDFGKWTRNDGAETHTRVCSFNSEHTETENCHGGTATCTEPAICTVCGEKYENARGHDYGDLISKTEPTCSATGTEAHYKCSVCNKVFKDDEHKTETTLDDLTIAINPDAHNFGEWIKNEGADTHTRICSFNSKHTETENCHGGTATCTEQAVCEKCNAKYGEFAKHNYKDGVCIVCGIRRPSEGLEYSLNIDKTEYIVTGIGTCTDKEIIIPSEYNAKPVTAIGNSAFSGCTGLTSIVIPNSVTNIGISAFYNCTGLTSITIPNSVTSIGSTAFGLCSKLQDIYITDIAAWCNISGLYRLMKDSANNKKLYINNELATSITIPDGVTNIGDYAFFDCSSLTSIVIPNSVTSIGVSAFSGCSGLTSITIPNSVTNIGISAFDGCDKLQDIYITDIAAWCHISGLHNLMGYGSNNKNLYINNELVTSITIPNGVTAIPSSAFSGCSGLTSITIPNSVTSIGSSAFSGCTGLTNITIPDSVTSIGASAFRGCTGLTSVTIGNGVTSIDYEAFKGCSGLTSVTIGNSVTNIGQNAFYGCSGLTSITIPDSVTSIGNSAFSGCSGLTSATIPDSVTSIGDYAFSYCTGLTSVIIPNRVTEIPVSAFRGCSGLTSVTIPNGVTSIGDSAFFGCSGLTSIVIPNSVTSIGVEAFRGCSGLTSITIPDSVTSIGRSAFSGCSGLTSVTIGNSVTSIDYAAFYGCYKLIEVYNKSSLTITVGSSDNGYVAYYAKNVYTNEGGSKLTEDENGYVIYTDGDKKILVTYLGTNTELILPSYITEINQYAFYNCTGLTSVTIGNSVTSIGPDAFEGCTGLTTVNWNATACTTGSLSYPIFEGCSNLATVNIGANVTTIPSYAFYDCSGLTSIIVVEGNSKYHSAGNCLIETTTKTLLLGCKTSVIPMDGSVTSIGQNAFYNCTGLTSVVIPNSVTSIDSSAFSGCTGLTSVTIPDSVTSIGAWAFQRCTGLKSVTIGNGVTSIGDFAFEDCTGLTSITFNGTKAQWNAILKGTDWKKNIPATEVVCTDGRVSI